MISFKTLSFALLLIITLSACTKDPIKQMENNIETGNLEDVPGLDASNTQLPEQDINFDQDEEININLKPTVMGQTTTNSQSTTPATPQQSTNPTKKQTLTPPPQTPAPQTPTQQNLTSATISTSKGDISFNFDLNSAPNSSINFASKSQSGFYNGLVFHRVEDWVIQGGDPLGTGTGGGDQPTELSQTPFTIGSVGIARGPNIEISNDAQFFICTTDCGFLTGQYTLIGQLTAGLDIAKQIQIGDQILGITIQ